MPQEEVSLEFAFSRPWTADGQESLFYLLSEEAEVWNKYDVLKSQIKLGYTSIEVDLEQFLDGDLESFDSKQVTQFLPPTDSPQGMLLISLLEHGRETEAKGYVLAFFVVNGWAQSPFEIQNAIHGANFRYRETTALYVRGLALLSSAYVQSLVSPKSAVAKSTERSSMEVRKRLSALKANLTQKNKLLQNNLANFRRILSKLQSDRSQIRAIAVQATRIAVSRFEKDRLR